MCGIAGIVDLELGDRVDPEALDAMAATLVHRGPDSSGRVVAGPAGLAMRRLSIIDVAGGEQPLRGESGDVHLVCNGEIYNHRELRAELTARGHRFATGSDCEAALHAYEEWGDGFLPRLNGMFALALWDARRRRLLLARDRMGIKPLYHATAGGRFLFGSEPKAILAAPGFERALDLEALDRYLAFEYVPSPGSMFRGIRKLRPGHRLTVDLATGKVAEEPWFQLDLAPDPGLARASEDELAERVWQALRESVRLERMSDVPLGVFLSGGVDSSAVAAAMTEIEPGNVHSFAIGFEDASFDESAHARAVAAHLGTVHHERILSPRMMWELVPSIAGFLDEPMADASIVPTHLLSRFAREHVTVALGGDGGDELFAGYPTVQAHRLAELYLRLPRLARKGLVEPLVRRLPVSLDNMSLDFRAKRFVRHVDRPPVERHHLWLGAFAPDERARVLADGPLRELAGSDPFRALDEHLPATEGLDSLSRILYIDCKMYLEGDILVKVDRASMGCSLEVRVPMLNRLMLDLVPRLPARLKLRGLTRKYLFRKAVRGRLPDAIIDRPKKGFGFPVSKWFRSELKDLLHDQLAPARLARQGLFDPGHVAGLLADHMAGIRDNRKPLWTLLVFQLWHERWMERGGPR